MPPALCLKTTFFEDDVLDLAPRAAAILVAHREQHAEAGLARQPVVLDDIAGDPDPPCVLQLDEVLDRPLLRPPADRLRNQVVADDDVARNESLNGRIGATKQDVFGGALQIVVGDGERPGAVPAGDRLRVLADALAVRDVGAADCGGGAVQRHAPLLARVRVTVDVAAVDDDIVRDLRQDLLAGRPATEGYQVAVVAADDFQQHEAPVVRPRCGLDHGSRVRRRQLRHQPAVARKDPRALRHRITGIRTNRDEAGSVLRRQREVADVGGAGDQRDGVAWLGVEQRGVQISIRRNGDRRRAGARGADGCCKEDVARDDPVSPHITPVTQIWFGRRVEAPLAPAGWRRQSAGWRGSGAFRTDDRNRPPPPRTRDEAGWLWRWSAAAAP